MLRSGWVLPWPSAVRRAGERLIKASWTQPLLGQRFLVGVVGVVTNEAGQILLFRHTYRERYPWGLPTGFMERGEQPEAAMHREIREEAGFETILARPLVIYADMERPLVNIVFRGELVSGSFRASKEVSQAQFYSLDDLPTLLPDQRKLLNKLL